MRTRTLILPALIFVAAVAFVVWRVGTGSSSPRSVQPEAAEESARTVDAGDLRAVQADPPTEDAGEQRVALPPEPEAEESEPEAVFESEPDAPLPPDPLEFGECELLLEIFDRTTREPVAARVHLWRIDAPENEHWTAGAQCQVIVDVAAGGSRIRELPAGRYRARCEAQAAGHDDPEEFDVRCPTTVHRIDLELPRERQVLLRLHRADGEPILDAEVSLARAGSSMRSVGKPRWARDRRLKDDLERGSVVFGLGGGWSGRSRTRWETMHADADGWFRLGTILEGTLTETPDYVLEARVDGLSRLSHRFDGNVESPRFVAVLIDPEPIARSVVTPDGRTSDELEDGLYLRSRALEVDEIPDSDAWRRAPLEAWRRWENDFEDFELEFRLSDLPLPTHELVPKEPQDG